MTIKYVNQKRVLNAQGEVAGDWHDICHGHEKPYDAMECNGMHEALAHGKMQPRDMDELIVAAEHEMLKAMEFKVELRIVKRTISDEVYDA